MSTPPLVPTGVVPSTTLSSQGTPDLPRFMPAGGLKSDAPSLLDKWSVADEQKLRDAHAHIEQAQARRNTSLQAVDEALSRAGVNPDLRDAIIANATSIRAALAPFDVKPLS